MNRKEMLRSLVENPTDGRKLWHVAESLFQELRSRQNRDEEKALWAAVCYRLAAHFEDNAESWGRAGTRLMQLRIAPLIQVECFTRALQKDPHNIRNLISRASVYKHLGMFEKALEDYEQACQHGQFRVDHTIYLNMAECYHRLGRYEPAWECFRKALELAQAQGPDQIQKVQNMMKRLGYGNLLPATEEVPNPKAGLKARINELVDHGLPADLADHLRGKVEALSPEKAEEVVKNAVRYWELYQQRILTEDDVYRLVKGL